MNVARYSPPPDHPLHPYLYGIWECGARGEYARETILPKGIVDIIFNLGGAFNITIPHSSETGTMRSAPYIVGMQMGGITSMPQGDVRMFGMSLRAESCSAIVPVPAREIAGRFLDAALVFRGMEETIDRLHGARSFRERCAIAMAWIRKRLDPDPQGMMVMNACRLLNIQPNGAGIDRAASDLNLSSRHLRRLFQHHLGVGPSHYIRLRRFIHAVGLISPASNLTEIAHAAWYYDQAHFCRDFKDISGMTPTAYQSQVGPVPGHLFIT